MNTQRTRIEERPINSLNFEPTVPFQSALSARSFRWLLCILFTLAVFGSLGRSILHYDEPDVALFEWSNQGQFDFHNGVYFPSKAFLQGVNPYSERFVEKYPVTRPLPLLSPWTLLLHAPLALLPVQVAELIFFLINVGLCIAVAWFATQWMPLGEARTRWFLIACVLVVGSRSGHTTLFTGYATAELVVGTFVALTYAVNKPWLSAVGVCIASCKPTYAIPLFLLMVARGDHIAAWRGVLLSVIGAMLAVGRLLLVSSPGQFIEAFIHGQSQHMADEYELPVNTWTRVDVLSWIAKWCRIAPSELVHLVVMVFLLLLPALALWHIRRLTRDQSAAGLSSGVIAVSILATIYHHVYDAMLVFPVVIGLFANHPDLARGKKLMRWTIAGLMLFVTWNYLGSELAIRRLHITGDTLLLVASTGPIALTAAWLSLCALPFLAREKIDR